MKSRSTNNKFKKDKLNYKKLKYKFIVNERV